jgi:hypothetical protein
MSSKSGWDFGRLTAVVLIAVLIVLIAVLMVLASLPKLLPQHGEIALTGAMSAGFIEHCPFQAFAVPELR